MRRAGEYRVTLFVCRTHARACGWTIAMIVNDDDGVRARKSGVDGYVCVGI